MNLVTTTTTALLLTMAVTSGCKKEEPASSKANPAAESQPMEAAPTTAMKPTVQAAGGTRAKPALVTERGFPIHTAKSADPKTGEAFDFYMKNLNFVPNLGGIMAESPVLVNSYLALQNNLQEYGSLTPPENNIVQMSIAMENECQYCVAGHTLAGKVFFKSPDEQMEAIRAKSSLPEPKLNALRDFAIRVHRSQGRVTDEQLQAFLDAGYTRNQALDVVANIAAKVMSNYTNQLARTPLDEQVAPFAEGLPFAEKRAAVKAH